MQFNVGDIIRLRISYYKILELNKQGTPYKVQGVKLNSNGVYTNIGGPLTDYFNNWHGHSWELVQSVTPPFKLSAHDKKYEKIILKMKQLDDKFKKKSKRKDSWV